MISKTSSSLSVKHQCLLMDIAPSSYYYEATAEREESLLLMENIDKLHLQHPYYGARRMTAELSSIEKPLNVKRISRLMHKMDISVTYPKPNTSKASAQHQKFPYLLTGLVVSKTNQVWSTDITYIPMKQGFMYLCAVMDSYSRQIPGWTLSNTLTVHFCIEALQQAIEEYGTPGILNTDQGSQFTSEAFIEKVKSAGIRLSMDGKGRATDNALIERFWRSLKYEHIYLHAYDNNAKLFLAIGHYINFYNHQRKHQSLNYQTPSKIYTMKKQNDGWCKKRNTISLNPFTT